MTSNGASPAAASGVEKSTIESAVTALLKYKAAKSSNEKVQLLPQDDYIYLNLTLKKIPSTRRTNPFRVLLPHPILDPTSELCLIIDDRPKTTTPPKDQIKKLIKSENIPISKIINLSKLKTNYKPFEAKRKLCESFDLFLVDKRIVHLLPKLIGKEFFRRRKLPLGVDFSKKNLKVQVEKALGSALLYLRTGTCCTLKVGKMAMEKDEIVENVFDAIKGVVEKVPKKWDGVRSLHLKFFDSVALPIYQALPDVKLKIEGLKEFEKRGEIAKVSDSEGEVKEGGEKSGKRKKGRIHEVHYMDVGEGVESDDVEIEEALRSEDIDEEGDDDKKIEEESVGKKRRKGKASKKGDLGVSKQVKKKAKIEKKKESGEVKEKKKSKKRA